MQRVRFAVLCVATLAIASACNRGGGEREGVVRSDSAGVRIITNTAPDRELGWTFDTIGVLLDSLGEPWVFTRVSPAWVLTDRAGRTYVVDEEPAVRRFGRDGRYERSFGRRGGGPGEMMSPLQIVQQGDTVGVLDLSRNAIVRWGVDLRPIADLPIRGALEGVSRVAFRFGGVWVQRYINDSAGRREVLIADTVSGTPLLVKDHSASPAGALQACGIRIAIEGGKLFSPELLWHASAPQMVASAGADYEVDFYQGARLFARVRRDLPLRKPTSADLRRQYPQGLRLPLRAGAPCVVENEVLERDIGLADTMPMIFGLARFREGTLWVRRSLHVERPSVLDVFGTDGTYLGTVKGLNLPVGQLPNDELLVPIDDEASGGIHIARVRVKR